MRVTSSLPMFQLLLLSVGMLLCIIVAMPLFVGKIEFTGDDYLLLNDSARGLWDIWTRPSGIDFVPVTITSLVLDTWFWGQNPKMFHLTNLVIYFFIGVTAYRFVQKVVSPPENDLEATRLVNLMTGVAVFMMLLHPMNMESLASVAQRRELLYALFGLLALCCYADAVRIGRHPGYAWLFVLLAQLSKETAIVIPALFLAIEVVAGNRADRGHKRWPVFAVGLLISLAIFIFQVKAVEHTGLIVVDAPSNVVTRLGGVVRTANFILLKFLAPAGLTYDYDLPRPAALPPAGEWLLPIVVLAGIVWVSLRRNWRCLALSSMPIVAIAPYLNILHFGQNIPGQMIFFDHYMLMPTMLASAAFVALIFLLSQAVLKVALCAMIAVVLVYLSIDYYQVRFWQNRETLYSHMVEQSPRMPKGYFFLGRYYLEQNRYREARRVFTGLLSTKGWNPTFVEVYQHLGDACTFSGDYLNAEINYRRYLNIKKDDIKSLQNLSTLLIETGRCDEARLALEQLLRAYPGDYIGTYNMKRLTGDAGCKKR